MTYLIDNTLFDTDTVAETASVDTDDVFEYQPVDESTVIDYDLFLNIAATMAGEDASRAEIAKALRVSYPTVVRIMEDGEVKKNVSGKISAAWNDFVRNGGKVVTPVSDDPGDLPFVEEKLIRCRLTGRFLKNSAQSVNEELVGTTAGPVETDGEIVNRIEGRFNIMSMLVKRIVSGSVRSMIVQGAPGIGKTYTIQKELGRPRR